MRSLQRQGGKPGSEVLGALEPSRPLDISLRAEIESLSPASPGTERNLGNSEAGEKVPKADEGGLFAEIFAFRSDFQAS